MTLFTPKSDWPKMPEITWYRASDHYRDAGGTPLWTRADIAKVRRWVAKLDQMEME
jgi:hypothetical protein